MLLVYVGYYILTARRAEQLKKQGARWIIEQTLHICSEQALRLSCLMAHLNLICHRDRQIIVTEQ